MTLWTFLTVIVALALFFGVIEKAIKVRGKVAERTIAASADGELGERIAQLEARIENLETVILEHEKLRRFDALHDAPRQESSV